jgi:ADP-heptose:LPS heptosyltransferase
VEADACASVAAATPKAVNLCDDSPVMEVMALARAAALAVGNDTGPLHLIAAMGCPTVALFSQASSPEFNRPRGPYEGPGALNPPPGREAATVTVIQEDDLGTLGVERVLGALAKTLDLP